MAIGLVRYLIKVSEDPAEHARWAKDREGAIRASGLSKKNKDILLRGDSAEIEEAIHKADSKARVSYHKKKSKRRYVTDSYVTVSYVTVSFTEDG